MLDDIVPEPAKTVLIGGGALSILGICANFLWRIFSRGRVDIRSDRAEENQIIRLEREVARQTLRADTAEKRADTAYGERNDAIERSAIAIAEVTLLRRRVEELETKIDSLQVLLTAQYNLGVKR